MVEWKLDFMENEGTLWYYSLNGKRKIYIALNYEIREEK